MEYDGSKYMGFQLQKDQPTIQGEIEKSLTKFTGEIIRIRGASRTDSGAHARGQVVDFSTESGNRVRIGALSTQVSTQVERMLHA